MKFLTKINRQYLITISILLLFVSVIGYFVLKTILTDEIKEDIFQKEYAIINEIKTQNNTPNIYPIIETKLISKNMIKPKSYKEIFIFDKTENENEPYLEYTNTVKINNKYYLIRLRHSLIEADDLIIAISLPLLLLLVLTLTILFFTTKKINKTVWKDFEENLKAIENFSFNKLNNLKLKQTNIQEFDRLNKTLTTLTKKLTTDYNTLKEFTENASHEIQTPISIILLNLEEILQQDLQEKTFKQLVTTINAVKRLSNLNKSLLLLSKIENKQYIADNKVLINNNIKKKINELSPLINSKGIRIHNKFNGDFFININSELADVLLNNLLFNAINHNIYNGNIYIEIHENELTICNTGSENSLTNKTIFNRFSKENSKSYGLGLAIVKQICNTHNMQITYKKDEFHCFILKIVK